MNQSQCNQLRDIIFSQTFKPKGDERPQHLFRYVAVTPGGHQNSVIATVSYAFIPLLWKDHGLDDSYESSRKELHRIVVDAGFKAGTIEVVYVDHLQCGWNKSWSLTAKDPSDNLPTLILRENAENKSVTGVLMRNACMANPSRSIGNSSAEAVEAARFIEQLRDLNVDDVWFRTLYKESKVDAQSLGAAITHTPESASGQKYVYLYRDNEWFFGIWNNPNKLKSYPFILNSIADYHGTRISEAKKQSRQDLDIVRKNQTLAGNYDELLSAIAMSESSNSDDLEQSPGVRWLCDWWNRGAPENMRFAGCFRIYVWDESNRIFLATDPDEPACSPGVMASEPSYSLFEECGQPTIQLTFYKGRIYNSHEDGTTWTHYANGDRGLSMGCDLKDVDEAYYSHQGLRYLADIVEFGPTE